MLTVHVGQTSHWMSQNDETKMRVSFNKEFHEDFSKNPPLSGPASKSRLRRITVVSVQITGESGTKNPVRMTGQLSLSISQARELAEDLLRSTREAEVSIEEHGQDG
ncbi:hypothetical protein N9571_01350 [Yoonia sp.]|nr:hypothetical protein [Yoonia sp.]